MKAESGSVLLEYVLLQLLIGVVLLEFSATFWSSHSGWGVLGEQVVGWAHRLSATISLPVI